MSEEEHSQEQGRSSASKVEDNLSQTRVVKVVSPNADELRRKLQAREAQQTKMGNTVTIKPQETTTSAGASGRGKKYITVNKHSAMSLKATCEAAEKDPYELKERVARGAESVLYRAVCGSFTFCAKSIRNGWSWMFGGRPSSGEGEKLENVKYDTKIRHIKNEYAVGKHLAEEGDIPIVRIYAMRPVKRLGIEVGYDLLMEYLNGHDLSDKVLHSILPFEDKVRVFYQAVSALDYVHRKKVVHLDIKPSNFMLVDGKVKLIDFGVSVMKGYKAQALTGTTGYMSPEQICKGVVDERTDIFALGVSFNVFFGGRPLMQPQEEMLTKTARQDAKYNMESNVMPMVHDIPDLIQCPELGDIIRQCTIPCLEKRTPNCALLLRQIKQFCINQNIFLN